METGLEKRLLAQRNRTVAVLENIAMFKINENCINLRHRFTQGENVRPLCSIIINDSKVIEKIIKNLHLNGYDNGLTILSDYDNDIKQAIQNNEYFSLYLFYQIGEFHIVITKEIDYIEVNKVDVAQIYYSLAFIPQNCDSLLQRYIEDAKQANVNKILKSNLY